MGAALKVIFKFLGSLPISFRIRLGRAVGWCYGLLPTRERKVADLQLQLFSRELAKIPSPVLVFQSLAQTAFESLDLKPIIARRDELISVNNKAFLEDLVETRPAALLLTAHIGNWDLLGAYGSSFGLSICTIGREARHPALQEILQEMRWNAGLETLWKSDPAIGRKILGLFRSGKMVAAVIDQDTTVQSLQSTFFHYQASTPSTIIEIARRAKARIITAFLVRTDQNRYKVFLRELQQDGDVLSILEQYHRALEEVVFQYPEQWAWNHKRWRTIAPGVRLNGNEYLAWLQKEIPRKR